MVETGSAAAVLVVVCTAAVLETNFAAAVLEIECLLSAVTEIDSHTKPFLF